LNASLLGTALNGGIDETACDANCGAGCIGTLWTPENQCMLLYTEHVYSTSVELKTKYCFTCKLYRLAVCAGMWAKVIAVEVAQKQ